jgi:hypothetical protein
MNYSGMKVKQILTVAVLTNLISFGSFANDPNILFIISDDMEVDAIDGFNIGDRHPVTPNLDALRSKGVTFTNVWATPVCAATRASLMTGKYGLNNGVNTVPGSLTAQQTEAKEELINLMVKIRGEFSNSENPGQSPKGKAGMYPVVHTGVTSFYGADDVIDIPEQTNALFWQDAGRVYNSPSYTDNGDKTITDDITGLVWQKDMGEKISFFEALEKVENLNDGGYDDWRIPTIKELYSLIQFSGRVSGSEAITPFIDTNYFIQPLGDVDAGERTIDAQVWSYTHYTGLTMRADTTIFGVNFIDGRIKGYPKYNPRTSEPNKMYFRMVRGNTDYGNNVFSDNDDGTVSDSASMLMWQKADDGIARDWLSSIQYCEELEFAGYSDWHLPSAKELQSIVDYYRSPDATNSAAIDTVFYVSEIEDPEGNPGHYPFFWTTTTHQDGPNPYSSAVYVAFGEALGEMNENLLDVHGAGAQRSDPKTGLITDYPKYHGPQGDVQMVYNHCRCVRQLQEENTIIPKEESGKVQVFPNPFKDGFSIQTYTQEDEGFKLKLYNMQGALVFEKTDYHPGDDIYLNTLDSGIYLLSLEVENTFVSRKIVKK